jgi:type IV pilus assembly protein PilP
MRTISMVLMGCAGLLAVAAVGFAAPGMSSHARQINPMQQDSLKVPPLNDVPRHTPSSTVAVVPGNENAQPAALNPMVEPVRAHTYDPSGRRDPFVPVLQQAGVGSIDSALPPLQRVGLTEINLIAVLWGAYGNAAMVQTPDGNGYTVRRGTRIGPNNGMVTAVTDKGIVVQERFTDVYGSKQEREYVKLLHPKEGAE